MSTNPALILKDAEIKKYFLSILQSNLSDEDKYKQFIDFFEIENEIKSKLLTVYGEQLLTAPSDKIGEIVSAASQTAGIWRPEEVRQQTHASIGRAIQRLKNSQHHDGGWGFQVEVSHPWATAYAVLCLNAAKQEGDFDPDIADNLRKGLNWLKDRSLEWSTENSYGWRSVYDVSIVIRCCYEAGKKDFPSVEKSWRRLLDCQNKDGGWDAGIWPEDYTGPTRVYSDVGATSTALQALATVRRYSQSALQADLDTCFVKGLQWFKETQNEDGSWNNKSCTPASKKVEGVPSITKTCDAIKGILIAKDSSTESTAQTTAPIALELDKAVDWLLNQEKPLYDRNGNITGWGWESEMIGDQKIADLENTWLTLETLVQIKSDRISLPLLTANAQWLLRQQHKPAAGEDSVEDGKWEPKGHTARIALSLIEFYKKIKDSPLFAKAADIST